MEVTVICATQTCCVPSAAYFGADPRRACHLGLMKLDFSICPNCTWFGVRPPANVKLLSGGEAMTVMACLETMRPTDDPLTGARAPDAEPIKLSEEA